MPDLFNELERGAWGGFVRTQSLIFRAIEEELRTTEGITHAEFEVLLRLYFSPERRGRIQELAEASLLTRSGTSRLVERLERAGFLSRIEAEEDGRGTYAVLTGAGSERFRETMERHVALIRQRFLSHFTPEELKLMASWWRRIEAPHTPPKSHR